ncbi:hypothetical protein SAVIM338S_00425 [Streptomyces avidinii]
MDTASSPSTASAAPTASTAQLTDEAQAALRDVTDASAQASLLAALAVAKELQTLNRSVQGIEGRLKQLNKTLGAIANKP